MLPLLLCAVGLGFASAMVWKPHFLFRLPSQTCPLISGQSGQMIPDSFSLSMHRNPPFRYRSTRRTGRAGASLLPAYWLYFHQLWPPSLMKQASVYWALRS